MPTLATELCTSLASADLLSISPVNQVISAGPLKMPIVRFGTFTVRVMTQ